MPIRRGRASAAQQQIEMMKTGSSHFDQVEAVLPYDLTDTEAAEWVAITKSAGPGWFPRETFPLLTQLCREIVRARKVAQLISQMEKSRKALDLEIYQSMLRTEMQLSASIASLSGKARLSQSSMYDKSKRKSALPLELPWVTTDND